MVAKRLCQLVIPSHSFGKESKTGITRKYIYIYTVYTDVKGPKLRVTKAVITKIIALGTVIRYIAFDGCRVIALCRLQDLSSKGFCMDL